MSALDSLKAQIHQAFTSAKYPGDDRLRNSDESDEPFLVERDFRGKHDWRTLSPQFIDGSPDGFGSALSFFTDEAFRFFLPAYLVADIDGQLKQGDPVFYLTHGLEHRSSDERINPKRYGDQTWSDYSHGRFAAFTREEAAAIVGYLTFKRDSHGTLDSTRQQIQEALTRYWNERAT